METTEPIIALTASEYKRVLSKIEILYSLSLDWIGYFENDFENDEDQPYHRMETYIEAVEWLLRQDVFSVTPYRERMLRRVKERLAEHQI